MKKATRLYIYYRVPLSEVDRARQCARLLFDRLHALGVGSTELLVRIEHGKPYSTLMEVVDVPIGQSVELFKNRLQDMATLAFQDCPKPPERVVEVFVLD